MVRNCSAQTQGKLATSSAVLSRPLQISMAFLSAYFYMYVYLFIYAFYFKASSNRKKVIEEGEFPVTGDQGEKKEKKSRPIK